jgi:two-component system NtrC family sensor kinase
LILYNLKAYCLIGFLVSSFLSNGQSTFKADSLVEEYKKGTLNDSSKLVILRDIAFYHSNGDSILLYSNKLINFAKELANESFIAKGYFQLAYGYRLLGDYKKSTEILFATIRKYEDVGDKFGIATSYLAIGDIYNVSNNHDNSVLYYKKAISELRQLKDSIELASALSNIGDEYFNHNELDSALSYLLESKDIFQRIKYEIGVAYALGNIGLVYAKLDMNGLAEGHINQATIILEKLGDKYPIAVYQTYMADIYKEKGDMKTALLYAAKSLKIGLEEGLKEQIRDANLKLSELYQVDKNFEKAYHFQSQYLAYRDSINNDETIQKIADLRTEYEVSKKQIEVDLLNSSAENQRILVINLVLIVLLIAALAYLYYHRSQVRLRVNKLKSSQKLEMEAQRDQLELLNETKDKFFSIISHDLRSPVANFKGVSHILKKLIEANDKDKLRRLCDQLDKSASELTTLLDNLLYWALNQQGRFPYNPERVDIYPIIASTMSVLESMAKSKNIELTQVIEGKIELFVDKNSAETIIRNLISNSLKFTNEGGEISITVSESVNMAEIKITDTGVGMSEEVIKSLFDFKAKKSKWGTSGEKGVGLGLLLVNDFVVLNGGSIEVQSEVGVGSNFNVYLPLA